MKKIHLNENVFHLVLEIYDTFTQDQVVFYTYI